ncbi:MAG: hypothetical protein IJW54_00120 [Clostridia bacterium]|nr:hypothetical protein [Clostridia bacterium]
MKQVEKKYRSLPFWSWNDELDKDKLVKQVEWMNENGIGGFFMHARGGLKTPYLGNKWHECIEACTKRAKELGMEAYAYDENGWPSGFVGGKLLEDIENRDKYLTHTIGKYDENALVSYDISGNELKRVNSFCDSCLNVYEHYSASTADILNPLVVDKFLNLTHEEYRKRDKDGLKGFFTDEPQYYRWDTPYTRVLPDYFKKTYGEDILDGLGLLFVEKEGYRSFRYKYWKAMQTLMLESFGKKIYNWCDKHGYKLTGHYIEEGSLDEQMLCCAGIMPFYEYEHIPGIDYLGSWISNGFAERQVVSVSAQLGKKQILTETFAGCGWNISPKQLKKIAECQYVCGVNLMCQHLLPFGEHGQRKRDYPAHFSSVNPWVKKGFLDFNNYFSYLGKMLAESKEYVNVGVFHPIRSAYFNYKRFDGRNRFGLQSLEKSIQALVCKLGKNAVGYHFLDETIMAKHARVENGSLIVGNCKYDYIIFPQIFTMDKSSEALISKYVSEGGKVLLTDLRPEYLEGEKYEYSYLESNTTWEEIIDAQPIKLRDNEDVRLTYRHTEDKGDFVYAVNLGKKTRVSIEIEGVKSFDSYDILSDKTENIPTCVEFENGQSYILYPSSKEPVQREKLPEIFIDGELECERVDNYLTLDTLRYSKNGIEYSEKRYHMCAFDELLKDKYEGRLYLKYEFEIRDMPTKCSLFSENDKIHSILVNGKEVKELSEIDLEVAKRHYDIVNALKKGENEIVILIDYYQGENVYYALFGDNVTEGLKNCLAYDTEIEPIYLRGDFGVYGNFDQGKRDDLLFGSDFYIGKQKTRVKNLIKDGFPFFSGDIVLNKIISVENTKGILVIDKPFLMIDVKINDTYAGRMMLENRLDISSYLKKGENKLSLTLTVGNRNLLGPFHTIEGEPDFVGPETFERFGSWENGKSKHYSERYSFVKSLI